MTDMYAAVYSRPASEKNPRSSLFVITEGEFPSVLQNAHWFAQQAFDPPVGYSVLRGMVRIYNLTTLLVEIMITAEGMKRWNEYSKIFIPVDIKDYEWQFSQEPTTGL